MFRRRSNSSANPPPLAPFHRSSFAHPTGIGAGGGDSGSSSDRLAAMTKELERMKAELRAEYGEDLPLPERKEAPPRPLIPTVRTSQALKATFDDSPMFPEIDPPGRPSTSLGLSQRPLSFPPAPGTGITPNAYGPPVVYLASGSNFFITNVTPTVEATLGYSPNSMLNKVVPAFVIPQEQIKWRDMVKRLGVVVAHPMTEQATRQMALMEWKTLCKRDAGRKHAQDSFTFIQKNGTPLRAMVDIYYSAALKPTSAAYGVGIVITKITPLLPSTTSGARLPSIAPRPNMPLRQTDPFLPSYAPPPPIPARRRRTSSFAPGAAGLPFPPPLPLSNNPDLSSLRPLPPLPPLRSDLTVPPLPQGSSRSRRASMAHPNNYIPNLGAPNYASIGLGQPRPYPGGGGEFGASGSMTRPNPFIRAASVMPMQSRPRYISHMPLDTYAPESYKNFFELPKPPSKEPVLSPLRGPSKKKP